MTLQDFFVSGLSSNGAETQPAIEQNSITTSEQSENDQQRVKTEKQTVAVPAKSLKRIESFLQCKLTSVDNQLFTFSYC